MPDRRPLIVLLVAALAGCGDDLRAAADGPGADSDGQHDGSVVHLDGGLPDGCGRPISACVTGRRVLVDEVANARDLGGTPLENQGAGVTAACGQVYRGAALYALSACGCAEVTELGIRTVIDLRTASESWSAPESPCVTRQAAVVAAPLPIPYSVSPADYVADLDATASIAAAFAVLGDPAAYPVYFHCVYGRDRSGVLAAVILLAVGATRDAVLAEYQLTAEAGLATYPASLEAVLDAIDARGGVDAYLAAAGVPPATVAVLRDRLTPP
jgi:protein-tyrosine phosphatase